MRNILLVLILFAILISFSTGCSNQKTGGTSSASWAYPFVVWNGYTYNASKDYVDEDKIYKEIGSVTVYSDKEGNYKGNFSIFINKGRNITQLKELVLMKPLPSKKKTASIEKRLGTTNMKENNASIQLVGLN